MSQEVSEESLKQYKKLAITHHGSSNIFELSKIIPDANEKNMLRSVSTQVESSTLTMTWGLYRQAFFSLRLALEFGLATVYFSVHKIEHIEWINGKGDIVWSSLLDNDKGVLTKRFANAFFPELSDWIEDINVKARMTYRSLSEFVHGNVETWRDEGLDIRYKDESADLFYTLHNQVYEVLLFALSCRYMTIWSNDELDSVDFLKVELNHIVPIRTKFSI